MLKGWRREERLLWKLVRTGSRKGRSKPSRAGDVLRQPIVWGVMAGGLALAGPDGRRAAVRGTICSLAASVLHLPIKRVFRRPRPRGAGARSFGPLTSSFPSGHTATDLSFLFGAAQELPAAVIPLSIATLGSHWSLLRTRKHYPSDIAAGGAIAFAVSTAAWKIRPPHSRANVGTPVGPSSFTRERRPGCAGTFISAQARQASGKYGVKSISLRATKR